MKLSGTQMQPSAPEEPGTVALYRDGLEEALHHHQLPEEGIVQSSDQVHCEASILPKTLRQEDARVWLSTLSRHGSSVVVCCALSA